MHLQNKKGTELSYLRPMLNHLQVYRPSRSRSIPSQVGNTDETLALAVHITYRSHHQILHIRHYISIQMDRDLARKKRGVSTV